MPSVDENLNGKGKAKEPHEDADVEQRSYSISSRESTTSGSDDDSSFSESDSESITQEYLDSLIAKAKAAAVNKRQKNRGEEHMEEEVILLDSDVGQKPLPPLDPGPSLPRPYFNIGTSRMETSSLLYDLDAESLKLSAPPRPAAPPPPPELNKNGKPLTKQQIKERKKAAPGSDWVDLPEPAAADLPRLHREVEAIRLRNALDPKRFYRKEEGEGKGIKGLPKRFAIGTILPSSTPFGTPSADNLPRAQRKRTVVDELVDDAEAKRYAKKKFLELQGVRGARGRGTWARKQAARRGKW